MSVPDRSDVPKKLYDTGLFNLKTEDGEGAFTDAVVACLNGIDSNWQHLKKSSAQTNIHRHGEDSALYLLPDGTARAVDFIGGAGGSNPKPGWIVDEITIYKHSDAHDPDDHGLSAPPPPPAGPKLKPREDFYFDLGQINGFYASSAGLQRPGGMVKFDNDGRTIADVEALGAWGYDLMLGTTVQEAIRNIRHSDEWRTKHPNEQP